MSNTSTTRKIEFSVPVSRTIDSASGVMVLLILGWGSTFFGQLVARRAQAALPEVGKAPQMAATD